MCTAISLLACRKKSLFEPSDDSLTTVCGALRLSESRDKLVCALPSVSNVCGLPRTFDFQIRCKGTTATLRSKIFEQLFSNFFLRVVKLVMVILVKLIFASQKVPQYIIKFIIIVSQKRHPIFNLTNLTLTKMTA